MGKTLDSHSAARNSSLPFGQAPLKFCLPLSRLCLFSNNIVDRQLAVPASENEKLLARQDDVTIVSGHLEQLLLFPMTRLYKIIVLSHPVLVNSVTDCILLQSSLTNTGLNAKV